MDVSASPKKVLFAITKAFWGGAQRYVFDLAVAARDRGYAVTVLYGEPGPLADRLAARGITAVQMPALARDVSIRSDLKAFFELIRFVRELRPDVVHLNSSKAVALGVPAARLAGVRRIVHTSHGWAFNEARPLWQKIILVGIHSVSVWLSPITICVSEAVRRDMRWLPFARMRTIHLGVSCPTLRAREDARQQLDAPDADKTWIGMTCELHPTKRIEDAIDAIALLRKEYPDVRLIVMGEGAHRPMLEQRIRAQGVEDRVFLVGFVPDAATYLPAFDLFLHTSRSEALGYAILEAGCASLPVVATDVGGIPEIIEHNRTGLVVPSYAPEAVAAALRTLLSDEGKAEALGSALNEKVHTDFSREQMVEETLALY